VSGTERVRGTNEYSRRERAVLWAVAVAGGVGLNGVFFYGVLVDRAMLAGAMGNPLALAFIAEALLLTGVLAYLLGKWQVTRLSRGWFVVLALAGGLAFALPVASLWRTEARPR
jgi:hypothetical protein